MSENRAMAEHDRIRRQQVLREAEGYLELLDVGRGSLALPPDLRDRLAQRVLELLRTTRFTGRTQAAAWCLEGQALRLMERYAEAVEPLRQSAALHRHNLSVWLALGWCYKRLGRLDLAIQSLEEALQVCSEEPIVHYNLACYWSLVGNRKLAVRYLSQAFDLDPRYRELVGQEPDFDPIRDDQEFQRLLGVVV